ncbi:alpha/beta-hydrolase [Paramyrothecium foliicola]|nr:alpha/beta-hydrolase [Paramyrothecium foliicola]
MEAITFQVSRGFTYSYLRVLPSKESSKPYLLFLHGFPSIAAEWQHQIAYFTQLGYGVIAPDLLGYGGSSRPTDVSHYRFKDMNHDVVEILDHEEIDFVYGVGHDMGAGLLARLSFYFPRRFNKLTFLVTGYLNPGSVFDLDGANVLSQKDLGYALFGYMKFFTEDSNAVKIINCHQESFTSLLYAKDPDTWKEHLGPIGAFKQWLLEDRRAELGPWMTDTYIAARNSAFSRDGGYQAPLKWYHVLVSNLNLQDEPEADCQAFDLECSVLLVLAEKDAIALPSVQLEGSQRHVKRLTVKKVSTGHWPMQEAPDEINAALQTFFENGT